MEVITINNRQVIKCVHCDGTGMCKQYNARDVLRNQTWYVCNECTKCDKGPEGDDYSSKDKALEKALTPVCAVCAGKGYAVV